MDQLQRLALTSTRNLRVCMDGAYRQGNNCLQMFRNMCTNATYGSNGRRFNENDLLCQQGNTRQRFVEIAHTQPNVSGSNLIQRRHFSASTVANNATGSNIFNIQDDKDFKDRVLANKKPVVVDFYAVWCGPCKVLAPKLEQILAGYEGKVDFAKVDIDKHTDLAFDYNVSSVPTVIAFKNGKAVKQFIGVQDDDKIRTFVKSVADEQQQQQ